MSRPEPIVIVGSRLQAIAAAAVAAALAVALIDTQPVVIVPAMALAAFALSRLILRVELHTERVVIRRWRGQTTHPRSAIETSFGHRYLHLAADASGPMRIEVPVEIRPAVRTWVDDHRAG